ncbi:MAG: TonB-dependent receptor [Calditrichaeota bacterium]|nr:MAG: TonB-dependent receptor [Calditrichota bacterium]
MNRFVQTTLGVLLALTVGLWAGNGKIAGKITDKESGEPLIGANVTLQGTVLGAATDMNGEYVIENVPPGTYTLVVEYIGYEGYSQANVTVGEDATVIIDVELAPTGIGLQAVTVTASRRAEKALDAPASVSVLSEVDIRSDVSPTSASVLRNVTGIDVAQTGIDRREIVVRGFNNAFSGAAYVLTDYRQAAVPALAVNVHSIMPNMAIDLDRVEIVRGPGSALYGPGVDAGVIHYITKDPFSHPGTTISMGGGNRSKGFATDNVGELGFAAFRQAGKISENLAYKITGQWAQADDWRLDGNDPIDAAQLQNEARPRNYYYSKRNANGLLEWRVNNDVTVSLYGGLSYLDGTVLTGVGTAQADNFGYFYGQFRVAGPAFFIQGYVNQNDGGDSFVYGNGDPIVDKGRQIRTEAQYSYDLSERQNFIVGGDLNLIRPNTEGTIYGRNEQNDDINQFGGYIQSTTRFGSKLDLILALRGDIDNIIEEFQLSPRVGLVFKPAANHSVRATYNRAFTLPGVNSLFLDIVAAQIPIDPTHAITVRGRGSKDGYHFQRNSQFAAIAGTDLVARSLNPATAGAAQPVGLPLDAVYASVYQGLAAIPPQQLQAILAAQGINLDLATIQTLVALLDPSATQVQGFSRGLLGIPDLAGGPPTFVEDVKDIQPLKHTITNTVELGYKGIIENKVMVAVDAYYTRKENFVSPLRMETPMVFVPNLSSDLTGALANGIANNPPLAGALQLINPDLTPDSAAALITKLVKDQLPDAETPVAIVVPRENDLGEGKIPELMLAYRSFGEVEFFGVDVTVQVQASDRLRVFANASWVEDDFFTSQELNVENPDKNPDLSIALNAPTFKAKGGFSYDVSPEFTVGASGRFVKGFPVQSGPYVGGRDEPPFKDTNPGVEDYFLLDLNGSYHPVPGLQLDVMVLNALNDAHREFVGAPKLGRSILARVTASF